MLIVCLVKGVPAKTTRVTTVSGVLRREEMDLVLNPHDSKAIEAAYYVKRVVGGKTVGISMGPEPKITPIMRDLAETKEASFYVPRISFDGLDERIILSDRRMAGADTWATSYTLACGINKVLENHVEAVDRMIETVKNKEPEEVKALAEKLYNQNLLPNYVYSRLPTVRETLTSKFAKGELSVEGFVLELEKYRRELGKFIILTGMKTSDGETGNTGPQTAEALSSMRNTLIPSIAFVRDFEVSPDGSSIIAVRKIGNIMQKLRVSFPCLLTIDSHYEPRVPPATLQKKARLNNYAGKAGEVLVWNADYIKADPSKLGLMGSPTIVGPGYEVGKPPTQKFVGETLVFKKNVEKFVYNGKSFGPFGKGDLAVNIPEEVLNRFKEEGVVGLFSLEDLVEEIFGGLKVVARAV
ncbi:MAG: hypothetical protein NZ570_04635 [Candidatus Caldarchaeum sp.]|nr:hypothetical protein [Candidatus Caldarchaeum sp.]MDW8359872.1 hypothetical protein [Candidatus Caldarchaeum sp.]